MAQYQSFPGAPGDSHTLDKLKALRLPDLEGRRFLDVGCNEGFFCGFARFQGATRSVGLDQAPRFIERARRRFPDCEFLLQGWDVLPDATFDAILLASALHYADDQAALIHRLVERLAPHGVLVLELGIVSSPNNEWVKVQRGIDERFFPTMPKLREVLKGYAWKWMGPSVNQAGDPVQRHIIHVSRRRPVAYLLLEPPGHGKSTIAASLFGRSHVPVVSGDDRLDHAAKGRVEVPAVLAPWFGEGYSPFALDRLIGGIFDAGHGPALLDFWLDGVQGKDFALDAYVPAAHHAAVESYLDAQGYLPVQLNWKRSGHGALPTEELVRRAEAFYLSLGEPDHSGTAPGRGEAASPAAPALEPIGFVDEVDVRGGKLHVRGWAVDASGNLPASLQVCTAAGTVVPATVERQLRTDVQRHHGLPHGLVGFRFAVDAGSLRRVEDLHGNFAVSAADGRVPFRLAGVLATRLGQSVARPQTSE